MILSTRVNGKVQLSVWDLGVATAWRDIECEAVTGVMYVAGSDRSSFIPSEVSLGLNFVERHIASYVETV